MEKDWQSLLSIICEGGRAEKKITTPHFWQGGASNDQHCWNNPKNWYNRRIPGWYDEVIISGKFMKKDCFPIIKDFVNDIAQLIVEPGGKLVVDKEGRLSVDGFGKKGLGIMNEGEIFVQGELNIQRTTFACLRNKGLLYNSGSLAIDKSQERGIIQTSTGSFVNLGVVLWL
jgi:hypothetical protein